MAAPSINEHDLHAYVDGNLTPERRQEVEAHIAVNADAAERISAYRLQIELIHTLYDPILDEPVPIQLQVSHVAGRGHWVGRATAATLLLLVGGLVGWWIHELDQVLPTNSELEFAHRAARAYAVFTPEVRHPVEVGAEAEQHLVAWLSKRLKAKLKTPVLIDSGFNLVGGRLLADGEGPTALFMYEDQSGQRLTLYVKRHEGTIDQTAFRYTYEGDIGVFYWIDNQLSYAIAAQIDKDALLALSRVIYDQLKR